jgi:hypothetical protein
MYNNYGGYGGGYAQPYFGGPPMMGGGGWAGGFGNVCQRLLAFFYNLFTFR